MTSIAGAVGCPSAGKRSVLFLLPTLQGGGAERVVTTILRHLDRSRFDLTLAVVDGRSPALLDELPPSVEYIDLRCRSVRYAAPSILRLVWKRRPDVLFSTIGHLNLIVALMKPLFPLGVLVIARETGVVSETIPNSSCPPLWRALYRWLLQLCDHVVCQSRGMQEALIEYAGVPAAKTVVIHNPIDLERVRRLCLQPCCPCGPSPAVSDGSIHLVAVGRLSVEKGFDLLIEAVALCRNPRLRLCILGEGQLRRQLEVLAVNRGVGAQVRFVGFQANPYHCIARANALVLSSRHEGFPNVALEALACGTPVIATPAPGGISEILQGRLGSVLTEEVSALSLAKALATFPFECDRVGHPLALTEFSAQHVCAQYAALFI